ncbi:Putative AC9 transposase-like protein [Cladobotryum mycophilum]|uniref:AC9 transposase-like protein n=1 Tax=Cladobotryum mycophilum TaxID=491253 RepID=A0ABR0SAT1_9HYPO
MNRFLNVSLPRGIIKQLTDASEPASQSDHALDNSQSLDHVVKAKWHGRTFILEDIVAKLGNRGRSSFIKDHGIFVREILLTGKGDAFWVCKYCDEAGCSKPFPVNATSSPSRHLFISHSISKERHSNTSTPITSESDDGPIPKRIRSQVILRSEVQYTQELALGFLLEKNQPFTIFESQFLSHLLRGMDPDLYSKVSWNKDSQKRALDSIYNEKKALIHQQLHNALTHIHLCFDLWTSPNQYAIMAITAHFLSPTGKHQQRLLSLREQSGSHSGKNLALTLLEVINEWEISDRISTIISDNAFNNNTCLQHLFRQLYPTMIDSDITKRRMRCYGHILNLIGRAFLFGEDTDSFEQESQILELRGCDEDNLQHWRKKGPIGKLRNIIKYIRASPQRREKFRNCINESDSLEFTLYQPSKLEVILNNDTRWNSTFMMIDRALIKQSQIDSFIVHEGIQQQCHDDGIPKDDILTPEDWRLLVEIKEILRPLHHQTMRTQGFMRQNGHGQLWEVIVGMEYLLDQLEDWRALLATPTDEQIQQTQRQMLDSTPRRPRRGQRSNQAPVSANSLPLHTQDEYLPLTDKQQRYSNLDLMSQEYIRISVTTAWSKLNEYYIKLGESPLFAAAVILHPGLSLRWLEHRWCQKEQITWLYEAKEELSAFWDDWYRHKRDHQQPDEPTNQISALELLRPRKELGHYNQWIKNTTTRLSDDSSELDRYYRLDLPVETDDPVQWWISQKAAFPTLSKLALDIFAIPAMAADCEREFSLAKLTLSTQRLSMNPSTLEMVHCMKNWLQRGAITLGNFLYQSPA